MPTARTIATDVCVVGGGPAGATIAARLAQFGHDVCLVERARFPRPPRGESLTPGVLPLLEVTGARAAVEAAGFPRVDAVDVSWDDGPARRPTADGAGGLLVDRGRFDALLLAHAREAGVTVLAPANARRPAWRDGFWRVPVDGRGGALEIAAPFLAVAGGRSPHGRRRVGPGTLALRATWRGERLPRDPRVEAGADAWYWGVPVPGGAYDTLAFVDRAAFLAGAPEPVARRFHALLRRSGLLAGAEALRQDGPVRAVDATPYLDDDVVTPCRIKVGDAALALDPLSSSGVQRALQSAVSGAVVANTLLRRPDRADVATAFHRDGLRAAFDRHEAWAATRYAAVAARGGGPFWRERGAGAAPEAPAGPTAGDGAPWSSTVPVRLSSRCAFVDVPCLDGAFVAKRVAVSHPALAEPVAYAAGWELAPLLRALPPGATALGLAQAWSTRVPPSAALAVLDWLFRRGILEVGAEARPGRPVAPARAR